MTSMSWLARCQREIDGEARCMCLFEAGDEAAVVAVNEAARLPVEELNERQLIGLQIIHDKGSINSGEYCAATGASERTALRDLSELVDKGVLVTRGKKRWLRYYLP